MRSQYPAASGGKVAGIAGRHESAAPVVAVGQATRDTATARRRLRVGSPTAVMEIPWMCIACQGVLCSWLSCRIDHVRQGGHSHYFSLSRTQHVPHGCLDDCPGKELSCIPYRSYTKRAEDPSQGRRRTESVHGFCFVIWCEVCITKSRRQVGMAEEFAHRIEWHASHDKLTGEIMT